MKKLIVVMSHTLTEAQIQDAKKKWVKPELEKYNREEVLKNVDTSCSHGSS